MVEFCSNFASSAGGALASKIPSFLQSSSRCLFCFELKDQLKIRRNRFCCNGLCFGIFFYTNLNRLANLGSTSTGATLLNNTSFQLWHRAYPSRVRYVAILSCRRLDGFRSVKPNVYLLFYHNRHILYYCTVCSEFIQT